MNLKEDNEQMAKYMSNLNKDLQEAKSLGYGLKDKVRSHFLSFS